MEWAGFWLGLGIAAAGYFIGMGIEGSGKARYEYATKERERLAFEKRLAERRIDAAAGDVRDHAVPPRDV